MSIKPGCCEPPADLVMQIDRIEPGTKILDCMEIACFQGFLVHVDRPGKPCAIFFAKIIDGTLTGPKIANWVAEMHIAARLFSDLCHGEVTE